MKTKQPRSRKAAKTVARAVRRPRRRQTKARRAKKSAAKGKVAQRRTRRKPRARLRAAVKKTLTPRSAGRRAVRRPKTLRASVPLQTEPEGAQLELTVGARTVLGPQPLPPQLDAQVDSIVPGPSEGLRVGDVSRSIPYAPRKAPLKASGKRSDKRVRETPALPGPSLSVPPILLEGDEPAPPAIGPGQKYALGPALLAGPASGEKGELPAAYGTEKLLLLARDPHWLYAHWDLTERQQRQYNALSSDRHLVVRVQPGTVAGHPSSEMHVHPESRHWFIHVERAATKYVAQLGYYQANRQWVTVAASGPTVTPPDTISPDRTLRFATIPAEQPLPQLAGASFAELPAAPTPPDPAHERALAEVIYKHLGQQEGISSGEIAELMRKAAGAEILPAPPGLLAPLAVSVEGVSSPFGGEQPSAKGFWLNLAAELVLYGATEPDASVTVGGLPMPLRPDGTFSCRFALPDGEHSVTVSAISAQGDWRQAELKFSRRTEHQGEVGAAPQDPARDPPAGNP